MAYYNGLI